MKICNGIGTVLYESSAKTIGETLAEAYLRGACLRGACLRGANLRRANLREADLLEADLLEADLREANLWEAYLRGADLRGADLREAYLPDLGNMIEIRTMQIDRYQIAITHTTLRIGCQQHPIEKWKSFSDEEINNMDDGALEWWEKWRDFIFQAIKLSFGGKK